MRKKYLTCKHCGLKFKAEELLVHLTGVIYYMRKTNP